MLGKDHGGPTKEENERLRGERGRIEFIGLDLKDGKVGDSGKEEEG